jgi:hypothetical protein
MTLAWMVSQLQETEGGLLDFDREYLEWVFAMNEEHCVEKYGPNGYRGWGMGRIQETLTTGYSLIGAHKNYSVATGLLDWLKPGDVARTPGKYEEYDARGGDVKHTTGLLMKGTNEKIHPSVRIRMHCGGKGMIDGEDEENSYEPRGLKGWEIKVRHDPRFKDRKHMDPQLEDANATGFVWQQKGVKDESQVLQESTLGEFERKLLELSERVVRVTGTRV